MPGKKAHLLPKRETATGQMPAVKLEGDLAARAAELKGKQMPGAAHDTSPIDAKFDALHARFDTLEALIRERLNVHEDRLDGHDKAIADHQATLDDHAQRLRALERERKPGL